MSQSWVGQRCYGNVRLVDTPCLRNVQHLDQLAWPMIAQMHTNGIAVDVPYLQSLDAKLAIRKSEIEEGIRLLADDIFPGFNPASSDQVADLVFNRLGLVPPGDPRKLGAKGGKGGKGNKGARYSTEDEVLSSMLKMHPVIGAVLDHREVSKLKSTYTGPIPKMVSPDGRLRTIFKATRTATGRLSSGNRSKGYPNLQNIPVRANWKLLFGDDHLNIRNAFMAAYNPVLNRRNVLVSVDLSQIEMRIAAHLSGDTAMQEIFHRGLDIHTKTACALFQLSIDRIDYLTRLSKKADKGTLTSAEMDEWARVKPEYDNFKRNQRAPAKNLGFGVLYGLTAEGLRANIMAEGGPELSIEECQRYVDGWFAAYPGIKDWMELQYYRARTHGMIWDMFGRVRLIPEVRSVLTDKVESGLRQSGNMPIQASAQGIIKLAMAELTPIVSYYQWFRSSGVVCLPLLQVHDELIFEVSPDIADEFKETCRYIMRNAVRLDVPVDSSADVAERWGDLK
jgi:DNA polymerase I